MLEELLPAAWHRTDRYANNRVEADHGRLKARLRPMRGLKQDRSARVIIAGHGFVQNLRRGHYELAVAEPVSRRVAVAFDELSWRSDPGPRSPLQPARVGATQQSLYWSLTTAVRPHGAPASAGATVSGWFLAMAVVAILVVLTASAIYVAGGRPYLTDYAPAKNVGQDVFHLMLVWFVVGWLPQFVLVNIPASSPERWSAIGTILAGFLLLFGPAFLWFLENNDTHVERQRRIRGVPAEGALNRLRNATSSTARIRTLPVRILELADSLRQPSTGPSLDGQARQFLIRLSGHTAVQNTVALALATLSVVGAVGVGAGLTPTAAGVATLPTSTKPQPGKSDPDTDRSVAPV